MTARVLTHVVAFTLVVIFVGAAWRATPFDVAAPSIAAIAAAYLGVSTRDRLVNALLGAMAIGYLAAVVGGVPRAPLAFAAGVLAVLGRLVSSRLLVRGTLVVVSFGMIVAALSTFTIGLSKIIVDAPRARVFDGIWTELGAVVLSGLAAPWCFRLARRIDVAFARTHREREAVREGLMT